MNGRQREHRNTSGLCPSAGSAASSRRVLSEQATEASPLMELHMFAHSCSSWWRLESSESRLPNREESSLSPLWPNGQLVEEHPSGDKEPSTAEGHRPLVFLCSRCRRPLGDSLSWVANQEDTNCILLRCVTCNVSVNEEQMLSKRKHDNCCILQTLYCTGCSLSLGYLYRCTPKDLDYKRDMFCLSVEAIERYV